MAEVLTPAESHDEHDHKPHGWRRWVYSTNHKDIGTMYLVFACIMFFIGGGAAMLIRLELFSPGLQFFDPQFFNSLTTMHALIMIFGAIMPAWTGLANWMIPMQLGAPDMALPRLNNFSFWLLPFAFTLLISSCFVPGGAPAGGWTMYPPLILQTGAAFPMLIFAVHLMGASSILGAINVIVTIMNMRAPPGTKNEASSSVNAKGRIQKLRLFRRGSAMSGAPSCNGIIQFASPVHAGITAPKIISSACMVVSELKNCGSKNCSPGLKSSRRISIAAPPPMKNMVHAKIRYIVPMSL